MCVRSNIPLCARGTFLVHGVTVTMGGEFGCLIVLITPLGRVGRRDALGADLSIVSSTDWHIMSQSSWYFSLVVVCNR